VLFRHRAFPIVQQASGTARIFSCRYHGWTYRLDGQLTKAPRFTEASIEGFDLSKISLFPIHIHVDNNGFVYANLDARPEPEIGWEQQYGHLDCQDVLLNSRVNWDDVEYDMTWTKNGAYNWKLMQDNYNECYHCLTAHPDVARTTELDTYVCHPFSNLVSLTPLVRITVNKPHLSPQRTKAICVQGLCLRCNSFRRALRDGESSSS
jgi:phenylpropionate dioxygenase-like ring-hydroxylating dioxygenase large terminal subunit